ncbi:Bcr/CflA family multidrug efflux MFS transporter [Planctomicrobium sp. SH527]|uniref:Bcr/CflA family multidrug efflux MFS transporter n=1 Tax=Planctomicrobium sp. SH527 TaxID=3448123 RepID=UPI003F5B5776
MSHGAASEFVNEPAPSAPSRSAAPYRSAFRFILLLGLVDAFGPLGIDMYLPAFPQIEQSLQAPSGSAQLTLAMFLAGLGMGQILFGPLSDRFGRRIPLLLGTAAFAIASLVCAFATSIQSLIAARFVMGLAGSTGMVIARAIVRDSFNEKESARVYSMLMLVIGIAPIISPSLGAWLMQFGDWQIIFYAIALFSLICWCFAIFELPETHPKSQRSPLNVKAITQQYLGLLVNFRFMGYALAGSFALGQIFAYVSSAPTIFMQIFEMPPHLFSIAFAANAIGLIGIAQVNRWLTQRFSTHTILLAAMTGNLLVGIMLPILAATGFGGPPLFMLGMFLCLTSLGLILPNATAAVMAPFPKQAGVASALYGTLQFLIGSGAGAIVGLLDNGTAAPMACTIAFCAIATLLLGIIVERKRQIELAPVTPEAAS